MNSAVIVLTPNGRRQTVKVQPNTTILKVLEEVCEKHKFDPNEHDLKHHKRIVDLTTPYRFAGLPNNALLEMVEAEKKRQDSEVELVVQLGDGTRLTGQFGPSETLLQVIEKLCPNEKTGNDLFAIYMRTEVPSDKMGETSLKDLGLLSGRAIIRLIHRDPNAAKIQANVALNLQSKPIANNEPPLHSANEAQDRENKVRKTGESIHSSIVKTLKEEKVAGDETPSVDENQAQPTTSSDHKISASGENMKDLKTEIPMDTGLPTPEPEPVHVIDDIDIDTGEVHILGDRNAVLFTLDAANSTKLTDIPDSFFELGVQDIKLLIRGLRSQAEGTIDQPLLTAKLREMEEEQSQLSKLNRYKTVILRIQFSNRYVLQGNFTPYETIDKVMHFVREYLKNSETEFYLYTTPPKNILEKELRLFEADCVPSAILHFGCDDKQSNYLKEDILEKVSSPKASLKQALIDRGLKANADSSNVESFDLGGPTTSQMPRKPNTNSNSFIQSSSNSDAKLPKWFKPFGK